MRRAALSRKKGITKQPEMFLVRYLRARNVQRFTANSGTLLCIESHDCGKENNLHSYHSKMFDHEDLKWLASQATELNQLIQQVARHTDQVRQHQCELRYLELLTERVGLASRKSQELFDHITSRILTGLNTPVARSITPAPAPARTSVVVKIPVGEIRSSATESEEGKIQNPDGKRELILLVDDNQDILEGTGAILSFADYRVVLAKDGPEALRVYRKLGSQISLVILDYFLPVMDGDAVFDELKGLNPNVQIVLSSGFGEQAKLGSMLDRGLRGFIPKPYTRDRLIEQIRTILDS
jgi:CheY-like chemotaxis protein